MTTWWNLNFKKLKSRRVNSETRFCQGLVLKSKTVTLKVQNRCCKWKINNQEKCVLKGWVHSQTTSHYGIIEHRCHNNRTNLIGIVLFISFFLSASETGIQLNIRFQSNRPTWISLCLVKSKRRLSSIIDSITGVTTWLLSWSMRASMGSSQPVKIRIRVYCWDCW